MKDMRMFGLHLVSVVIAACGSKPALIPVRQIDASPDVPRGDAARRDAELAKVAARVFDAYANSEPRLTGDGKRVTFVSNRDGLPQLYVADATNPGSPARRVVASTERVGHATPTADGTSVVFSSDRGADENFSYFRVDLDGGGLVELTPGAKLHRDDMFIPDGRPDTIYYSARATSDVGTTVYSTSASRPGPENVIFKDDKPGFLVDVSPDGTRGLYVHVPSRVENYLDVVELATGTAKRIYPHEGHVAVRRAVFTADGKRVVFGTDGGGEQALVVSVDVATAKETARFVETEPATATIDGLAAARSGDVIAVAIDAGNHREIRLLDATTLKLRAPVTMPLGTGGLGAFSSDGKRLTLTWSTPNAPNDIYEIDTSTGKVTPLREEARPGLAALPAVETSIIAVPAFDHGTIPVNLYLPAGARAKRLPVIVNYHGGPAQSAQIRWWAMMRFFVAQGYAWVEPNVRGSTGFGRAYEAADNGPKRLDAFKDVETIGRWAAAQPWADARRVVVFGVSYGGYTVLVGLTRMPDLWRAGIELSGMAALGAARPTAGLNQQWSLTEFGDPVADAAFLDSISPLRDVAKITRPLFVYEGANDPIVPRVETDQIVVALRRRGMPVEYMVKDNEGHSLDHRENVIEFLSRSARFLEAHLE
jgi:dipeptidyl aminopeptidase/acylaminoacyl peptidase